MVAYHISNTYPHQITSEPQKWQRVEAYGAKTGLPNILHIMDSERPDQYRGVPYLAQVIEPLPASALYGVRADGGAGAKFLHCVDRNGD